MKQILSLVALIPALLFAQAIGWHSGDGPYSISTANDLKGLQYLVADGQDNFDGKTILLANDIVLSGNWTPIGDNSYPFKGVFDGQGYTISGLSIDGDIRYAGLFGYVGENGQIRNVNVIATKIKATSTVANNPAFAGGLAGSYNSVEPIENSSVKADSIVATGSANGSNGSSGGLIGYAGAALTISGSYASGNVNASGSSGNGHSGGLIGYAGAALTISNSYASGNVNATGSGSNGNVFSYSGGLVGYVSYTTLINNSYASGNVNAINSDRGGSYSGGLVGYAAASDYTVNITNSYASGNITGSTTQNPILPNIGGIFGVYQSGTMTSVYYKSEGASRAAGYGNPAGVSAISSDDLKQKATFSNWDFDNIWKINEGVSYPYLIFYVSLNSDFGLEIEQIPDLIYTGTQIKPDPVIRRASDEAVLIKGDDYYLIYGTNKNAGEGTVTITGINGYADMEETISFNIVPKPLTISDVAAEGKIYDGTTAVAVTGTLEGVIEGDDVSIDHGIFASKNVGNNITVTNVILTGEQAGNYQVINPAGLRASIAKAPLIITLSPKAVTIASSDPMSVANSHISYDGLANGEDPSVISGTTILTFPDDLPDLPFNTTPPVGTYAVTLIGSRTSANYDIAYDNEDLFLTVTEALLIRLPSLALSNRATQIHNGINLQTANKAVLEVYGLDGNLVSRQNFGSGVYAVSLGHLPKGMYIVKASFGSEKKMLKMAVR